MNNRVSQQQQEEPLITRVLNIAQLVLEIIILHAKVYFYIAENIYQKFFPKEEQDVRGEVVLITGAAHGIGKETALQYASLGAKVVCWDINEKGNADLIKEIKSRGGKAYAYVCNVTKREDIFAVAEKTKKEVGFVSIVINNAGIMPTHPLVDHNETEIRMMYDINVLAHFYMIQAFLPDMLEQKRGHFVALSSCAGLFGIKNLVPYCGTKFAVKGIMQSLHEELRHNEVSSKIKLTTIYPYMVDTGLCKKPKMRFPNAMKLVKPEDAASAIVAAQRQGVTEASIPKHFLYMEMIMKWFPAKALFCIADFIDSGVESDLS